MYINRRNLLKGAAAGGAVSALPKIALGQRASVLKFVPSTNLVILDPVANTSAPTQRHGYMVFDTLYGLDANYQPHPQMLEGHVVSDDKKTWTLRLRPGLKFHDNQPVLARDVVASLNRWAQRDAYGKMLFASTDELKALNDRELRFRLKKPFPLLPAALGKPGSFLPVIMPERLAKTSPSIPLTEVIGSGPFRFVANEFNAGSRVVYEKFTGYVPRTSGPGGHGAGPKVVHFDRVEWHIIPDSSTALAAMQSGEMDWWERPLPDFYPMFEKHPTLQLVESTGQVVFLRLNHLQPPFDNPAIRRLVLSCLDQTSIMQAVGGSGKWRANLGLYTGSMQTDAGVKEAFKARKDFDNVKRELLAAGYKGEKVAMMVGSDLPAVAAASQVGAETMKKMGFNVDYLSLDWGTVSQRRASMEPIDKGGWSCFFVPADADYFLDQATNIFARGTGKQAWFGWPSSPRIEELTQKWFDAPDLQAQRGIAQQIQLQAWQDVPYIPSGLVESPGLAKKNLTGFAPGFPKFFGVRRV